MQPHNDQPEANRPQVPSNDNSGQPSPQSVYIARPAEPRPLEVSQAIRDRHEASRVKYPKLNLSEGEYVISAVKRHWVGLVQIWLAVTVVVATLLAILAVFSLDGGVFAELSSGNSSGNSLSSTVIAVAVLAIITLALLGGLVASFIYRANEFFLTNESVVQNIQISLFAKQEQTVSLANIEDASYTQRGILQHLLNFGSLRLSTEGDETTYRFSYASKPREQIAVLNNAVEAFKNGRPFGTED